MRSWAGSGWPGTWVAERLGVELNDLDRPAGIGLADLVGLAVRRNPRRAHLLVSTVLGKHVPTDPRLVYAAGLLLGQFVRAALPRPADDTGGLPRDPGGSPGHGLAEIFGGLLAEALKGRPDAAAALRDRLWVTRPPLHAVVVGYAETATALGHCVADALGGAYYLHSTRRPVPGVTSYGGFEEEHSHATSHLLLPADAERLDADVPVVLVDDEVSTGTTVLNTIRSLHTVRPRYHYLVASLVDLRGPGDRAAMAALAAEIGAAIEVVALATGRVVLPGDALDTARRLVTSLGGGHPTAGPPLTEHDLVVAGSGQVRRIDLGWPEGLPDGGRHGFTPEHRALLETALPAMAERIAAALAEAIGPERATPGAHVPARPRSGARVLMLGSEELMYAPLRLAEALADRMDDVEIRYSTTTRSPVLAVDHPGYAVRTRLVFPAHDDPADGPGERYAYNVASGADTDRRFDAVVLVVDATADTAELADGLLARLTEAGGRILLATMPSYRPVPENPENPEKW